MRFDRQGRAATSVIGILLLVAVAVVIAVVVMMASLTFLDALGAPTADAVFEYEQTSVGLRMTPMAIGTDVTVRLNGKPVSTIESDDAGRSVLLPTAPGDRITVVSRDREQSVLVQKRVDERAEIGDFIAYYTFESGSGSTLVDRSGNDNDGTLNDDPKWIDSGLRFDGSNDHVLVDNLDAQQDVEAFTVATTYTQRGPGSDTVTQLVEHTWQGNEWFIETRDNGSGGYQIDYAVGFPDAAGQVSTGDDYTYGTRHVVVGTYDGQTFELYVDGQRVASGSYSRPVNIGDMRIGRDFESPSQYFEGDISELRLYYSAFDGADVRRISESMR